MEQINKEWLWKEKRGKKEGGRENKKEMKRDEDGMA